MKTKKQIFVLLLVMLAGIPSLSAQNKLDAQKEGEQEKYTIRGELPDHSLDGKYIQFYDHSVLPGEDERRRQAWRDSALIVDGKFYYEGTTKRKPFLANASIQLLCCIPTNRLLFYLLLTLISITCLFLSFSADIILPLAKFYLSVSHSTLEMFLCAILVKQKPYQTNFYELTYVK